IVRTQSLRTVDTVAGRVPQIPGALSSPSLNRGVGFTREERRRLALTGRLPSGVLTLEQQAERLASITRNLNRFSAKSAVGPLPPGTSCCSSKKSAISTEAYRPDLQRTRASASLTSAVRAARCEPCAVGTRSPRLSTPPARLST